MVETGMVDGRSERIKSKQRKECCWVNEMRASKFRYQGPSSTQQLIYRHSDNNLNSLASTRSPVESAQGHPAMEALSPQRRCGVGIKA
jgi:hypothetical protein